MLAKEGVSLQDVKLVNVNFSLTPALLAGQVDAVIGYQCNHFNMKALEMFDCARAEMLDRLSRDFSPALQPDGRTSLEQEAASVAEALQGGPQHFEWRHSRFDGTLFHAEVSLSTIEHSGEHLFRRSSKTSALRCIL